MELQHEFFQEQNSMNATLVSAIKFPANVLPGLWGTEEDKMHQSQVLHG